MKILVFTPTYRAADGSQAIRPETVQALDALNPGDHEVIQWISVDPQENKHENVVRQYIKAQKRAIREKFDALLCIEHDMLPPADAIIRLSETDYPVVYGVYRFRFSRVINICRAGMQPGFEASLSNHPDELRRAFVAGVCECSGLGFGCTLIRREVLERLPFHQGDGSDYYPDTPFARDCIAAGIPQAANFRVLCAHVCDNGEVLRALNPDGSPGEDVAVKVLYSTNIVVRGDLWTITPGETRYMPPHVARQYQAAGYVQIISSQEI